MVSAGWRSGVEVVAVWYKGIDTVLQAGVGVGVGISVGNGVGNIKCGYELPSINLSLW